MFVYTTHPYQLSLFRAMAGSIVASASVGLVPAQAGGASAERRYSLGAGLPAHPLLLFLLSPGEADCCGRAGFLFDGFSGAVQARACADTAIYGLTKAELLAAHTDPRVGVRA